MPFFHKEMNIGHRNTEGKQIIYNYKQKYMNHHPQSWRITLVKSSTNKPHEFFQQECLFLCIHHFSCRLQANKLQQLKIMTLWQKIFISYLASIGPASSAEMKKGEFAKTSLIKTQMLIKTCNQEYHSAKQQQW